MYSSTSSESFAIVPYREKEKLARAAGSICDICTSSRAFAQCDNRLGGRYVSNTDMSIDRSAKFTVSSSGGGAEGARLLTLATA